LSYYSSLTDVDCSIPGGRALRRRKLWPSLSDYQSIYRHFSGFAVQPQIEAVAEQSLKHLAHFTLIGRLRSHCLDIESEMNFSNPLRASHYLEIPDMISPLDERLGIPKLSLRIGFRSGQGWGAGVLIPPDRLGQFLPRQFDFLNRVVLVLSGL
jgi:hypothetical protein